MSAAAGGADELQAVIVQQGYSPEVAKLLMYELDTNLDGEISIDELRTGFQQIRFEMSEEELLAFFADSQEDESAPLEHPSVDRRFPPKRRRPADA